MQGRSRVRLQAINPTRNVARFWEATVGEDLFGATVLTVRFGRLGTDGRSIERVMPDEQSAHAALERMMRRRATAPRRINAVYELAKG